MSQVPHKTAVLPLIDQLTPAAAAVGAVNTVVNERGRLVGDNTDGIGFVRSLRDEARFNPYGARVLVLGGGRPGPSPWNWRAPAPARVAIANRTESRAKQLAEEVKRHGAAAVGLSLAGGRRPGASGLGLVGANDVIGIGGRPVPAGRRGFAGAAAVGGRRGIYTAQDAVVAGGGGPGLRHAAGMGHAAVPRRRSLRAVDRQ